MQVVDWISKQASNIADSFNNYNFYIQHTPSHPIDTSTTLSLTSYADRLELALIPCQYRWSRIKNGIVSEVQEFKGNSFICEPSDVGCIIQAEVTSKDNEHSGTAILKYGPVELDVTLKQTIYSSLSRGEAVFKVSLCVQDLLRSCNFMINNNLIRLSHCHKDLNLQLPYSLGEPIFHVDPKNNCKLTAIFSQKYQNQLFNFLLKSFQQMEQLKNSKALKQMRIQLQFINRKRRDQFLFIVKGFKAKQQLQKTAIINKIMKLQVNETNLNYLLEIQSLRSDLLRLFSINLRQKEEKMIYYEENCKLQQQIEDIISSYTKLIDHKFKTKKQFQQSFTSFQNKKDRAVAGKYQKIQEENQRLKDYIRDNIDVEGKENPSILQTDSATEITAIKNPFHKKKAIFGEIHIQQNLQKLLLNLSREQDAFGEQKRSYSQIITQKEELERKLMLAQQKIKQLQFQIKQSASNQHAGNDDSFRSKNSKKMNSSAMQISTNRIIEQKINLQKRYLQIKTQNQQLKKIMQAQQRQDKLLLDDSNELFKRYLNQNSQTLSVDYKQVNPQIKQSPQQVQKLKQLICDLQIKKNQWKRKSQALLLQLKQQKQQHQNTKNRLQFKVNSLADQLDIIKRNQDVLNRSQQLSMQLQDYNCQQTQTLKQQNMYLLSEAERLTKMCQKYKGQFKKYKDIVKNHSSTLQ